MEDQPSIWHGNGLDLDALTRLGEGNMNGFLGIQFVDFGADWLAATMPVDARTLQPFGLLHGGASVVLAETVSSVAGTHTLDPARRFVVGMEINANHVRSARQGLVRGVARAEALGRSTQVWTIRITDEEGGLVCISRATLAVLDRRY
ncbi:MAG TPA: hotdog fold thioesterase [Sphingobium sp.]